MKILIFTLTLALASPCLAGDVRDSAPFMLVASNQENGGQQSPGGRVVIKGKGGKVTDVNKKPKPDKDGKKKSE